MGIVWAILKILGMILLVILGVIAALAALVLFVPVRYRGWGNIPAEGKPQATLKITWLFSLISFTAAYNDGLSTVLRIAGIRFSPGRRGKKASGKKKTEKAADTGTADEAPDARPPGQEKCESDRKLLENNSTEERQLKNGSAEDNSSKDRPLENRSAEGSLPKEQPPKDKPPKDKPPKEQPTEAGHREAEPESLWDRLARLAASILEWIEQFRQNAGEAVQRLSDQIDRIRGLWDYYTELLESDNTQLVLRKLFGRAGKMLAHVRPRQLRAHVRIGTGDPASTANILAVYGVLYPLVGENITLISEFEEKCLEADFYMKGRIRSCVAVWHILCVILDRKVWTLVRQLKKEDATNG